MLGIDLLLWGECMEGGTGRTEVEQLFAGDCKDPETDNGDNLESGEK